MDIRALLPICLAAAVHAQSAPQPQRTLITVRVIMVGVARADSGAVTRAVRTGFEADSAFRVEFLRERSTPSGYFAFAVERPVQGAVPSHRKPGVAGLAAVVTCTFADDRRTLRVQITDARDGRLIVDSFVQLRDDQPVATAVEQTMQDVARSAARLVK